MDDEQHRLGVPVALDFHGDDFELAAPFIEADPPPRCAVLMGRDASRSGMGQNPKDRASADPVPSCCLGKPDFHAITLPDTPSCVKQN